MKQLMALFAVLLSVSGIFKAEHEDENGALMTYTHRIAFYDDNLLNFYYSTARIHIDGGRVRHWLKLERWVVNNYRA